MNRLLVVSAIVASLFLIATWRIYTAKPSTPPSKPSGKPTLIESKVKDVAGFHLIKSGKDLHNMFHSTAHPRGIVIVYKDTCPHSHTIVDYYKTLLEHLIPVGLPVYFVDIFKVGPDFNKVYNQASLAPITLFFNRDGTQTSSEGSAATITGPFIGVSETAVIKSQIETHWATLFPTS